MAGVFSGPGREERTQAPIQGRSGRMELNLRKLQPIQQLIVNPVEPSITEDDDHITIERFLPKSLYNCIGTRFVKRWSPALADRFHDKVRIESLVLGQHIGTSNLGDTYGIGETESLRKGVLKNLASCRVGTRLEYRPETGSHILFP